MFAASQFAIMLKILKSPSVSVTTVISVIFRRQRAEHKLSIGKNQGKIKSILIIAVPKILRGDESFLNSYVVETE